MRLVILVMLVGVAACWRESPPRGPQRSFAARVTALAELHRGVDHVDRSLLLTRRRIIGLASEAEREALHADLVALEHEVARLGRILSTARQDGEDPAQLVGITTRLSGAASTLAHLRRELRHTRTHAELEAFEALERELAGAEDAAPARRPQLSTDHVIYIRR